MVSCSLFTVLKLNSSADVGLACSQGDPGETMVLVDYQDRLVESLNLERLFASFSASPALLPQQLAGIDCIAMCQGCLQLL